MGSGWEVDLDRLQRRRDLRVLPVCAVVAALLLLGVLGTMPAGDIETIIARVCSVIYFAFFLLMPVYTSIENTLPEPDRVTSK